MFETWKKIHYRKKYHYPINKQTCTVKLTMKIKNNLFPSFKIRPTYILARWFSTKVQRHFDEDMIALSTNGAGPFGIHMQKYKPYHILHTLL